MGKPPGIRNRKTLERLRAASQIHHVENSGAGSVSQPAEARLQTHSMTSRGETIQSPAAHITYDMPEEEQSCCLGESAKLMLLDAETILQKDLLYTQHVGHTGMGSEHLGMGDSGPIDCLGTSTMNDLWEVCNKSYPKCVIADLISQ